MEPVTIVTVKNKFKLFKDQEEANSVELIELKETGFEIVAQKGLYQEGERCLYIQPDYCLSDIPLFETFLRPGGDPKKSILGNKNRIRAKRFNLHRGDHIVVYSNGILLPLYEVEKYVNIKEDNLQEKLGVKKMEEDVFDGGSMTAGASKPFPSGLYKTDEENIQNLWGRINYPIELIATLKVDGSSITIGNIEGEWFICSRSLLKPLKYQKVVGFRKATWWEKLRGLSGWKPDLRIMEWTNNDSDFVKHGRKYVELLSQYPWMTNNFILRGELSGGNLKGSGNKNNPASKDDPNIKFYALDHYTNGVSKKEPYHIFAEFCSWFNLPRCPVVFRGTFSSKEEIMEHCNIYFKENMVEGLVLRTDLPIFSAKIMNPEYDSKK